MGRKVTSIPHFTTTQWRNLADELDKAQAQYPKFLTFQAASSICKILAGVEETKLLAARLKLEVVPRPITKFYRRKGLVNRKRKGKT